MSIVLQKVFYVLRRYNVTVYERIENLRKSRSLSQGKLEKELGFSNGSISKWKNSTPTYERIQKIADYFDVSVNYLMTGEVEPEKKENVLTHRDERDIEKILNQTKEQLLSQEGLMFDGKPASQEAIDSILSAMQVGMELAKKKNKEKYTPKKYKKD